MKFHPNQRTAAGPWGANRWFGLRGVGETTGRGPGNRDSDSATSLQTVPDGDRRVLPGPPGPQTQTRVFERRPLGTVSPQRGGRGRGLCSQAPRGPALDVPCLHQDWGQRWRDDSVPSCGGGCCSVEATASHLRVPRCQDLRPRPLVPWTSHPPNPTRDSSPAEGTWSCGARCRRRGSSSEGQQASGHCYGHCSGHLSR